jgi:uncharacterized damage-inducible protein DinB
VQNEVGFAQDSGDSIYYWSQDNTMKIDEVKLLYEYNYWADKRILAACANVTPEQYTAATAFGSLHGALVHTLDSEMGWRLGFQKYFVPADRLSSAPEAPLWDVEELTEADLPTLDAVRARWQQDEQAMRSYLDSVSDADLNGYVRYLIPEGHVRERVLWTCLVHVVNHGTQHRSEAAAILTSLGQSPGGMDMTVFYNHYYNLP